MLDAQPDNTERNEGDDLPPRLAWVARNRSGVEQHNTLTPVWEFAFSV
jgi:hypothetical protein